MTVMLSVPRDTSWTSRSITVLVRRLRTYDLAEGGHHDCQEGEYIARGGHGLGDRIEEFIGMGLVRMEGVKVVPEAREPNDIQSGLVQPVERVDADAAVLSCTLTGQ